MTPPDFETHETGTRKKLTDQDMKLEKLKQGIRDAIAELEHDRHPLAVASDLEDLLNDD